MEPFTAQGKTTTPRSRGIVEGTEFIKRFVEGKGELPLLTSCCPAWTDWMEKYAPDFTENFTTAKSPQQMLSALAKSYWAEKAGVDPKSIYMVSIMPCTAKKYEIGRDEYMSSTGTQDTDEVRAKRTAGLYTADERFFGKDWSDRRDWRDRRKRPLSERLFSCVMVAMKNPPVTPVPPVSPVLPLTTPGALP